MRQTIGALAVWAALLGSGCGSSDDNGDAASTGDAGDAGDSSVAQPGATGSAGTGNAGANESGGAAGSGNAGPGGSGGSGNAGANESGGAAGSGNAGPGGSGGSGNESGAAGASGAAGSGTSGSGGNAGVSGSSGAPSATCPDVGLDPSAGAIHYVCDCGTGADGDCVAGDDANPGTTANEPWQTYEFARTQFANLEPGDSIAFCRGGAFDNDSGAGTRWINDRCRADHRCVVRDYEPPWASGDEPRPRINALAGQHGFALEDGGDSNHEEGYTFLNLDLRGSQDGNGFFIYNDIDDVLICNVAIDGFSIGVHAAGSNPPEAGSDAVNERIVVRNSRITNNPGQGFLGACNGCAVEYSYFENNGSAEAVFNHNIYFSGASDGVAHDMRAVGNELYRSAIVDGECAGVSFVVHGEHDGLVIEGNTVREDVGAAGGGCWGIAVDTGYSEAESFRNVVIRGNRVINVGNVGIGLTGCDNCLVENNVVIHEQSFNGRGIAAPNRDRGSDDLAMADVTIRNNTVFIGADTGGTGIYLGGEGTGHVLVSNVVYYAGTDAGFSAYALDLDPAAYAAVDYNLAFFPNASGGEWVDGMGDLASWQASSSLDLNSGVVDPQFTSLAGPGYDLTPSSASSPLVDAGHPTLSAAADLTGAARDSSPDIGAYER